eukprot:1760440-Pyramimonas_sp.AAC.1
MQGTAARCSPLPVPAGGALSATAEGAPRAVWSVRALQGDVCGPLLSGPAGRPEAAKRGVMATVPFLIPAPRADH